MITRRQITLAIGIGALATPFASFAQSVQSARRIGFLYLGSDSTAGRQFWLNSLRRSGYEEGRNLVIEWRYADGKVDRLAGYADELVRLKVELIIAVSNDATDAAKRATQTIPIVMFGAMFPEERGVVKNLAYPGGNVTGTVWYANPQETSSKQVQIIKDAIPRATRVAQLRNTADPQMRFYDFAQMDRNAAAMGISLQRIGITRPDETKAALDQVAAGMPDALFVGGNVATVVGAFEEIAAFARRRKLVSLSDYSAYVTAGGLLAYGPNLTTVRDRTVSYVDRILRGAKPGRLPIEQSTKWEMVLNATTARAIGFRPPESFMLRVDRVVE